MRKAIGFILALGLLSSCATSFTGSAHIAGGRTGCQNKCAGQGLVMSALVFLGAYSTACVCSVPPAPNAPPTAARQPSLDPALAAIGGEAAGAIMEKQRIEVTRTIGAP